MGTDNGRHLDDDTVGRLTRRAAEVGMAERTRSFRALARKLREEQAGY